MEEPEEYSDREYDWQSGCLRTHSFYYQPIPFCIGLLKPAVSCAQGSNEVEEGHKSPGAELLWRRRITARDAEKSQQCHKYFLQCSTFASERPQLRIWGAKFASFLGLHLTSVPPCLCASG